MRNIIEMHTKFVEDISKSEDPYLWPLAFMTIAPYRRLWMSMNGFTPPNASVDTYCTEDELNAYCADADPADSGFLWGSGDSIATQEEFTQFVATVLKVMGIPSLTDTPISSKTCEHLQQDFFYYLTLRRSGL